MPSVPLEAPAQLETRDMQVCKETPVLKVLKGTLDPPVLKVLKEIRVHKAHSVHWAIKQIPAAPGLKAIPATLVSKVLKEIWVVSVLTATLGLRAIPEQPGRMGRRAQPDALVRRATPVQTPIPEILVPKVQPGQSGLGATPVPLVLKVPTVP